MKKFVQAICLVLSLICSFNTFSQDFGFTQYQYTPYLTNVAAIANGSEMRVIFNYRYQEGASARPFSTPMLSLTYPLINRNNKRWGGIGGSILNDQTTNYINTFGAMGGFAYNFNLSDKNKLSVGAQLGFFQRNIDISGLRTTSQYTGTTADNGEVNTANSTTNIFNIGSGIMWYQEDEYHSPTNFVGISALNINQPNTAFIKDNSAVLPIALIATAGYKVWGNEKIAIIPNAKFNFRTSLAQANLGASMRYFLKDQTGLLRNGYVGASLWYNTNEALSAMIELNQPNYIVAFSYDFVTNTNRQTWLTTGAPEITLIYKKAIIRKCKDTDKDGICDKEDECIDVPGILAMKGCPDKDNDGIPDYKDECPDSAGLARFNGCPDKDNDTIPDHKDECPQIAGLPIFKGCPDMDNDSIPDKIDACPDVAGLPKFNGCPDSDGDGFADKDDKCPTVPGVAALQGCPEEIKKPEIVNPEIQNLLPQESMDKIPFVQFARKSYTITQDFKIILDKIGAYAQKYPTATFVLEGHTDNIGSSVDNIALSKNRVDAVMKYLLTHGISPDRISTDGHGEHRPISENTSEEGRAKNRRVEILIMDK